MTDRATPPPAPGTAHLLHVLVSRLDRSADRILRADLDVSYARFLSLLMVGSGEPVTQRALADALGVTEPAVSRTVSGLVDDGLVTVTRTPGAGNRRALTLTDEGRTLLSQASQRLEGAFESVASAAAVDLDALRRDAEALLRALDAVAPQEDT